MRTAGRPVIPEQFFDDHQRATIDAAMARIIPTDDVPGAREAGTVDFLDRYLAGLGAIYAKPDGSGFETIGGRRAEAWQRRLASIRARYVEGIKDLDRRSHARFGVGFATLDAASQDEILAALDRSAGSQEADGGEPSASTRTNGPALQQTIAEMDLPFFSLLCLHTRQGFYADPIYGGNRDRVGWDVIGFPGPASLAEVHTGRYSTLAWFADDRLEPDAVADGGG